MRQTDVPTMTRPTENHELTQVSPSTTKGPKPQLEDISQREYDDRVQLMRLGKKSVLKVRCQLNGNQPHRHPSLTRGTPAAHSATLAS